MSRLINTSSNRILRPIIVSGALVATCALMPVVLSRASDSPDVTTFTYTVQLTQTSMPTSDADNEAIAFGTMVLRFKDRD